MSMWAKDETGVLVVANVVEAAQQARKAKGKDKDARAARGTIPPPERRPLPGMADPASKADSMPSLLSLKPVPPNPLLPLPRADARPFGAAIAMRPQRSGFGRAFGVTLVI